MMEKVGDYSFEENGEINPYDKFRIAKQLAKNVVDTLEMRRQQLEVANSEWIESGQISSIDVLDEDFGELLNVVLDREIEIEDEMLSSYLATESHTIDSPDYSPDSQIPFMQILKAVGYSEQDVLRFYDFTESTLPKEHISKSIATMELVRKIYGEE